MDDTTSLTSPGVLQTGEAIPGLQLHGVYRAHACHKTVSSIVASFLCTSGHAHTHFQGST